MDESPFSPFRVTWRLRQPICLGERPLHLDALLAWAKVNQTGEDPQNLSLKELLQAQEDLPLDYAEKGPHKIWKASALLFQFRSTPFLVQMTRRTTADNIAFERNHLLRTGKGKITQGTGTYKDFDLRITCQWVEKVEAYGIGNLDAVQTLINRIPSLGRLTRNGWGAISHVKIEPSTEAEDNWRYRTLPSTFEPTNRHFAGTGNVRPPYWAREQWEPVWEFTGLW